MFRCINRRGLCRATSRRGRRRRATRSPRATSSARLRPTRRVTRRVVVAFHGLQCRDPGRTEAKEVRNILRRAASAHGCEYCMCALMHMPCECKGACADAEGLARFLPHLYKGLSSPPARHALGQAVCRRLASAVLMHNQRPWSGRPWTIARVGLPAGDSPLELSACSGNPGA